jgi:hypothetical protein
MALPYDQINAVTQKFFVPKLIDNIFDSDPLWNRAKEKGWYTPVNGGTSIMQPLMYAASTAAGSYAPTDTLDQTDNDQFTSAEYQWKYYYANITITRADELKNNGEAAILNFVKNKVMAAEMSLKDQLQDGLYSAGSTATDIGGLRLIVDAGNTVGGIAQGTYSWWQSVEDSSTTTVSLNALQTKFNQVSINNNQPSVGICTRTIYNNVYSLLTPQQRFVDTKTAQAGFTSINFNGIPLISAAKCPASHLFFLNEQFIHLYYHPEENLRFAPMIPSSNQNLKTGKIYWSGNAGISNARMHAKFSALAN